MQLSTPVALTSLLPAIAGLVGLYLLFRRGLSLPRGSTVSKVFHYGFPIGSVLIVAGLAVALVASTSYTPIGEPAPLFAQSWLIDGGAVAMLLGLLLIIGILLAITAASVREKYQ